MKIQKTIKCAAAMAAVCLAAYTACANADMIGLNFVANNCVVQGVIGVTETTPGGATNFSAFADYLNANDIAGVYSQSNWNNYGRYGDSMTLNGSNGVVTPVIVSWAAAGMFYHQGYTAGWPPLTNADGSANGNAKMMDCWLESTWNGDGLNTPILSGTSMDNMSANYMSDTPIVLLSGLNSFIAAQGGGTYSIIIYLSSDNITDGRRSEHWLQAATGGPLAFTPGTDLTPHIFVVFTNQFDGTNFYQVSPLCTNNAAALSGSYIQFDGLTNDEILIRDQNLTTSPGATIAGIQILALGGQIAAQAHPPIPTPGNTIYAESTPAFLTEFAGGNTPIYYTWLTDGGSGTLTNIPGAYSVAGLTNLNLIVGDTATMYTNKFAVAVTNAYGGSTSYVTLNIRPASPPLITADTSIYNTNLYGFTGGNVSISATFGLGTLPITNQWLYSSTGIGGYAPVAGATSSPLNVTNLASGSAGFYKLSATNGVGSSNNTPSRLTVLARPAAISGVGVTNMYSYCVMTNNPVAYWKFEETNDTLTSSMQAYDYSGNNFDATYASSDGTASSGCLDGGENTNINTQYGPIPGTYYVNGYPGFPVNNLCAGLSYGHNNGFLYAPPLNLNTNTVTFTMWIYPSDATPVIAPNSGLFMNRNGYDAAGVGFSGNVNAATTPALGYTWNNNDPTTYGWNSHLYPVAQQWQFVAYVITPTTTTIYLYYVSSTATNMLKAVNRAPNTPEAFNGGTTWIGGDNWTANETFNGSIDEVAVFAQAMSESQIQNLFLRALGLTNGVAPSITTQPAGTSIFQGQTLQLSVVAGGIPSPGYYWQVQLPNSTWASISYSTLLGIAPTTNSTLYWTNYVGLYSNFRVVVTNAYGTITSSAAAVTMIPVTNWNKGLWTVNFDVPTSANSGPNTNYVGRGVLGTNTYWNGLSGSYFASTPPSLLDDGVTPCPVNLGATNWNNGKFYNAGNNLLLDQYMNYGTNGTSMVFTDVPDGRYSLAVYLTDAGPEPNYADRGATVTVQGVAKSVVNAQDVSFLPDNTVIYTNLLVTNGILEMHLQPNDSPLHTPNTEGDFDGAQLELITAGPALTGITQKGTNFTLSWVGGGLYQATNLTGPWFTNTASSPFTNPATGAVRFFRIYNPNFH